MIRTRHLDAVFLELESDEPAFLKEIGDHFSFEAPGAKFSPAFKGRKWDGRIRLVKKGNHDGTRGYLYAGLLGRLETFCASKGITLAQTDENPSAGSPLTPEDMEGFRHKLKLPMEPRPYQIETFKKAVEMGRALFLSPTSSGKSLIAYLIFRWYMHRTLIIVPTLGLVGQMKSDFLSYGCPQEYMDEKLVVTNWQAIVNKPKEWFHQFNLVFVDEAHLAKAKSITDIMCSMPLCEYRFGMTGSLDGSKVNQLVIEGLTGPTEVVTTTSRLMEDGHVAKLKVDMIQLKYPSEVAETVHKQIKAVQKEAKEEGKQSGSVGYAVEMDFLYSSPSRNKFITNLAVNLIGNTLVMFHRIEHGQLLKEMIEAKAGDRPVYLIDGQVDADVRNDVRFAMERNSNAILLGSTGTVSTGVNIKNLHNLIMCSPWKSRVISLQSIGRILRLHESKDHGRIFDIADDLKDKKWVNFTMKHAMERVAIYCEEQFDYRMVEVALK